MKLLITGAAGQLGRELCTQLENGGSALGPLPERLAHATVIPVDIDDADLTSRKETAALIRRHAPEAVIHCAAYTNVDRAESEFDAAFAANALAPRNVALACQEVGAKLVHLSTDYVFSGQSAAPYTECDIPAPASAYGRSKYLGEEYVKTFCGKWFVVRTSWLYGLYGGNFVKTMLRLADERDELRVVNDQRGSPTNAEDLAHHLLRLVPTKEYGTYHCTGGGACTWFEFASEIMRLCGKTVKVTPCTSDAYKSPAKRPPNSVLAHTMLRAAIGDEMRPWQEALKDYLQKMAKAR